MIGLHVFERESADAPLVDQAPLGVSGWAIRTRRGPVGKAIQVSSFPQFKELYFLEPDRTLPSYYNLRALWANAKSAGALAWISRVVGAGATPASNFAQGGSVATAGEMSSSAASFPANLFLPAGSTTFTGAVDGGGSNTATFTYTRASVTGSAATYAAVAASSILKLSIGGVAHDIVFAGSENTQALWLAAINDQIVNGAAVNAGGQTKIESDQFGSGANVQVVSGSTASVLTSLGLSVTSANGTGNTANARAVTAAEFETVFEAAFSGSNVVVNGNGSVTWKSNTTGASSSVRLTAGTGVTPVQLVAGFDTTLHSGSASGLTNIWTVSAGYLGSDDPGTWSTGTLYFEVQAASSGLSTERDLVAFYKSALDSAPVEKQRIKNLTNANVVATVNHSTKGSRFLKVALVGSPVSLPSASLGQVLMSAGTPGANGATPTETTYNARFADFAGKDIQIVAAPDLTTLLQSQNLESYSSTRGDTISVTSADFGVTDDGLESTYPLLLQAKSFLFGIRGWVEVDDEVGGTVFVPAVGHVIGAGFIRKVRAKGGYAHIAPAGPSANLTDLVSIDDGVYDDARRTRVNKTGFNPLVFESPFGVFLKTSRTFSTTDKWYSAHVRIQANFFISSFKRSFGILEQEVNNESTRGRLRRPIENFLVDQYNVGGLEQRGGYANNALVKCDEQNNTEEVVRQRRLLCDVTYRPSEVVEDITINLVRTTEGIKAKDA